MATLLAGSVAAEPDTLRFVVRVGGQQVGALDETRTVLPDGSVRTEERTDLRIQRGADSVRIVQKAVWLEERDGWLRRLDLIREGLGPTPWRDSIHRDGNGWIRERSRGGDPLTDTLAGGGLVGPYGIDRLIGGVAATVTVRTIDSEELAPSTVRIERVAEDTLSSLQGEIPCSVYSLRDSARSGTESRQWRDGGGRLLRETEPSLGWSLERIDLSPAEFESGTLDALAWKSIPVSGNPPDTGPCEFLLLAEGEVESGSESAAPIPDGGGVEISPGTEAGSWRVRVPRETPNPTVGEDRARWIADPQLRPYLEEGLLVDARDPMVRAFADAASRGAANPTEEALRLERAVHARIAVRDLGTVFATASQTLRAGRGDCTEHAVLLAACCRARGIPARLVAGFVPLNDRTVFHLWTEVYLGGWVSLDATRGTGSADPCAVPLRRWAQPEDGMRDLEEPIRRLAGRYRIAFPEEKG